MAKENLPFSIEALELGPMENFIYFIHDHATGRVAVVDPAWDAAAILERVKQQNLKITDILLTHSHFDHINALRCHHKICGSVWYHWHRFHCQ